MSSCVITVLLLQKHKYVLFLKNVSFKFLFVFESFFNILRPVCVAVPFIAKSNNSQLSGEKLLCKQFPTSLDFCAQKPTKK